MLWSSDVCEGHSDRHVRHRSRSDVDRTTIMTVQASASHRGLCRRQQSSLIAGQHVQNHPIRGQFVFLISSPLLSITYSIDFTSELPAIPSSHGLLFL
jgi:hypothetical protein